MDMYDVSLRRQRTSTLQWRDMWYTSIICYMLVTSYDVLLQDLMYAILRS